MRTYCAFCRYVFDRVQLVACTVDIASLQKMVYHFVYSASIQARLLIGITPCARSNQRHGWHKPLASSVNGHAVDGMRQYVSQRLGIRLAHTCPASRKEPSQLLMLLLPFVGFAKHAASNGFLEWKVRESVDVALPFNASCKHRLEAPEKRDKHQRRKNVHLRHVRLKHLGQNVVIKIQKMI